MYIVSLLTTVVLCGQVGQTANIFAVLPVPSKSHFRPVEALLKRLAEKGHFVDFATLYPSKESLPRYNELSLEGTFPPFANNLSIRHYEGFTAYTYIKYGTQFSGVDNCRAIFSSPEMQDLKKTQKKYDLVITQILGSDCFLGFGHMFKAPVVSIVAMTDLPWAYDRVGNPDNPSYIPNWYRFSQSEMFLYDRVKNTILWILTRFLYRFFSSEGSNQVARDFFGPNLPDLEDLALKTSLILSNGHFSMSTVRPMVPSFVPMGGVQIHEPRPLNKYFKNLVEAENDIIYLSMGSMLMTESFDNDKLQGMFDAFGALPYKVLWKADPDKFPKNLTIPRNIHFEKWMPQVDILCHPKTKLFVTHGGMFGSQEAIYCGVPRLGIPAYGDQPGNIKAAEEKGTGIGVSYDDISKGTILEAVTRLLNNGSYRENTQRMSRIFRDRPVSPLDVAVHWVEYVIRFKGAPHLKRVGVDLGWYQYYLLDVGFALVAGLGALFTVLNFIVKKIKNKQ